MADFDPDAYLAAEFDPDEYLKKDSPAAAPAPKAPAAPSAPANVSFMEALLSKFAHAGTTGLGDYLGAAFQRSLQPSADEVAPDQALAAHDAQTETFKRALVENQAIREAAGKQQPLASALGNVTGAVLNPMTLAAAPAVGAATGATKALQVGAPFLEKALRVGAAGTAIATPATAAQTLIETGSPIEAGKAAMSVAPKVFAMGAAPLPMAAYEAGAALTEDDPEAKLTRLFGGLALGAGGTVQALGSRAQAAAPKLRTAAEDMAVKALGMKARDWKAAGGEEGARRVARTALNEKLIGGDINDIGGKVLERKQQVGGEIGALRDQLTKLARSQIQAPEASQPGLFPAEPRMQTVVEQYPVSDMTAFDLLKPPAEATGSMPLSAKPSPISLPEPAIRDFRSGFRKPSLEFTEDGATMAPPLKLYRSMKPKPPMGQYLPLDAKPVPETPTLPTDLLDATRLGMVEAKAPPAALPLSAKPTPRDISLPLPKQVPVPPEQTSLLNDAFSQRMTPKAIAAKLRETVIPQFEGMDLDQVPTVERKIGQLESLGEEPLSFARLAKERGKVDKLAFKSANPMSPLTSRDGAFQALRRGLSDIEDGLAADVSTSAGSPELAAQGDRLNALYRDLKLAQDATEGGIRRAGTNRGFSLSDYVSAAGGRNLLQKALLGAANKAARQFGPSEAAVRMDNLAPKLESPAVRNVTEASRVSNALQATAMPEDERKAMIEWLLSRVNNGR